MTELVTAQVSERFDRASAEQVYDAWLDEKEARAWMHRALSNLGLAPDIRRVEIDARVGGAFFFSDMRGGDEARHWGTYRALDRPRLIEFTWFTSEDDERESTSTVRIEIQADRPGCTVNLAHAMKAAYAEYLEQTEQGWSTILQAIGENCAN